MSFAPVAVKDRRGVYAESLVLSPCLINMQSHSREATGTVTPFDKYAESKSRSDCCAVTVANPILLNMQRHSREARLVLNNSLWIMSSLFIILFNLE